MLNPRLLPLLLLAALTLAPSPLLLAQDAGKPAVVSSTQASPASIKALAGKIDGLLAGKHIKDTRVGIHVMDVHSGQVLYTHDAQKTYNPASNAKIVTAAAALDAFGPHHTFATRLYADSVDGESVKGNLYVEGEGDGFLLWEDMLDWASTLKTRGITTISGDIVVADGIFKDAAYLPPGYEQKSEDASYRAPVGSVSVNFNAVTVYVSPGEAGGPALIRLDPPNTHLVIQNDVITSASGAARRLSAASITTQDGAGTTIKVSGAVGPKAAAWSIRKRIDNPPVFAGSVLKQALLSVGISVQGEVRAGEVPSKKVTLLSHASEPLIYVLMAMNKWSNNFMAEQTLRALGTTAGAGSERGSWEGGIKVVQDFMKSVGADDPGMRIMNGSGLYTGNRYSAEQLAKLLVAMNAHQWAPEFKATLAISGVDGTLGTRLRDRRGMIRAKTGTLNEVTALSGYARTKGGREVAFVILLNDPPVRAWRLRGEQDDIARAIVDWEG